MITNRQRYEDRHAKICQRAEQEFVASRAENPRYTLSKAIKVQARLVRKAIQRRDEIAAVFAAQCAHLALKVPVD
ncbi:hypothetical protein [Acidobacterium sp. S8]|uniref:hypothetical protein n=1 Tax=Acidobacterium sp. S8 TaxID=1641854 RepID=UPI00131D150F|nr:hypothetical protein [Acidobacterium sp. S8]